VDIRDLVKLLRAHWIVVVCVTLLGVASAVALTMLTKPQYQASTRLFVATSAGSSVNDLYQGNRLSQERVLSYTELLQGRTLAQRTIDKLDLGITAESFEKKITATAKPDTVLISVKVRDQSPIRSRDIANALSDEFVQMVRELETPRAGAMPEARVVVEQRATVPTKPVTPKPARNVAFGLFVGLLSGIGLALLRDRMDNTVKDKDTVEEIAGAGLFANIPFDKERSTSPCISFGEDQSASAEAFRTLRTNLQFLDVDNPPRVLVVTSSIPSEGKTTTAVNLALALAEAEHKVVLVDGDIRRPTVHEYLNLIRAVGFSTVLSGQADLDDALQTTAYPGLSALTSGAVPPNPSELLGSVAAKKVLSDLRERFDYVIVDSPPLLAVSDAAIITADTDGVLLVAKFASTKQDQLTQAVQGLQNVGARILGVIFTMIPSRGSAYYNYNYRYYGYSTKQQ
jgi:capsular exopolysaccharide synthesis family protein